MNSKVKGSAFERTVCVALSLWVTANARKDVFWRSAMSGGRATVRGLDVRQAGDVCAVAPEGHAFCDLFYVECKHLKSLDFHCLLKGTGMLHKHFADTAKKALKRNLVPLLIARQNGTPVVLATYEYADIAPRLTVTQGGDEFYVYRFNDYLAQRWADVADQVRVGSGASPKQQRRVG
jgi:hypothetical protein